MRIIRLFVLVGLLGVVFCTMQCCAAEFRGAWVTSWSRGFFTKEEIDATIADAKTSGLNALVVEVRKIGDAVYQSDLEPMDSQVAKDFDPLAYTIEKAHAEGIRVCAWLVVYRVWNGRRPVSDPKHVLMQHPDWRSVNYDGKDESSEGVYADPGIPEYREFFSKVCEDIVKRYAVDAIHFDYVRYPGKEWGYSDIALKHYYAETGAKQKPKMDDPKWLQWKRDQVTAMVKLVHDRVKAINPKVTIQASTIPWGNCPADFKDTSAYTQVCQDWRLWMEKGLIDENCPMVYAPESDPKGAARYRGWIEGCKRWSYGRSVYIGTSNRAPEDVLKQVEAVRKGGLPGFVLFSFNQRGSRTTNAAVLGKGLGPAPRLSVIQTIPSNIVAARKAFDAGIALAMQSKLTEAIVELTKATELDRGYAEAFFRVGRCYLRSKDSAKAREFFEKTLAIDPQYAGAKTELAKLKAI